MSWNILHGDCIERMAEMEEGSVDAVVCDPPYGIGFMGHEWDQPGEFGAINRAPRQINGGQWNRPSRSGPADRGSVVAGTYDLSRTANRRFQAWCEAWAQECLRILKPGGHLLACGGSRTHHRLVCGIEDAGFEIRDRIETPSGSTVATPDGTLAWYFGSGFPKGKDVHKALCVMGQKCCVEWFRASYGSAEAEANRDQIEAAVAELEQPAEDAEWEGWNVALKPAHEPIVVARKPLIGTVAENVLEHGTGGINVDACRIGMEGGTTRSEQADYPRREDGTEDRSQSWARTGHSIDTLNAGRWPANVVLSHSEDCNGECAPGCPVAALDEQSGDRPSGKRLPHHADNGKVSGRYGAMSGAPGRESYGDSGGVSRFFYCAKTSPAERNAGLDPEHFPDGNNHPTVKPINLMRWLVRLVTQPGGLVLDPFLGSGSTGCAAVLEGFDLIGIEREPEYIEIAKARLSFWAQHEGREVEEVLRLHPRSDRAAREHEDAGQLVMTAVPQMTVDDVLGDIEERAA